MTVQVQVDLNRCQGHGKCMIACPEVFDEDGQGYPVVAVAEVPADLVAAVNACIDDCPERAISATSR
ncbi:ferredoxin [Rhodococcus wratislaviensis]|uniref:Putative 3Fe-4S ferredoxin n=1 Tax=Rhodococcus wratislaviensis NBRC 100605 TaxID=1219028 RepID=X0Q9N8_RHOWR|nr:ferredoxin [Rhodococcus wratislaviensis]GAF47631.1 putative 3Fe-4S ferredoxin [Rhodococcus wratislaviensis NBRC 100605]